MNSLLLVFAGIIAGIPVGAAFFWIIQTRRAPLPQKGAAVDVLTLARWEKTGSDGLNPALREMRRLYPTHDIVPAIRFLDLVRVKGSAGQAVRAQCGEWSVAAVVVDRRTGEIARVLLWSDDERSAEKTQILRKVGFQVRTIGAHADMEELAMAMAA